MSTRIAAHPLVVAVAMGLLAPSALESLPETPVASAPDDLPQADVDDIASELASVDLPSIDPDEFARVEAEWLAVR